MIEYWWACCIYCEGRALLRMDSVLDFILPVGIECRLAPVIMKTTFNFLLVCFPYVIHILVIFPLKQLDLNSK